MKKNNKFFSFVSSFKADVLPTLKFFMNWLILVFSLISRFVVYRYEKMRFIEFTAWNKAAALVAVTLIMFVDFTMGEEAFSLLLKSKDFIFLRHPVYFFYFFYFFVHSFFYTCGIFFYTASKWFLSSRQPKGGDVEEKRRLFYFLLELFCQLSLLGFLVYSFLFFFSAFGFSKFPEFVVYVYWGPSPRIGGEGFMISGLLLRDVVLNFWFWQTVFLFMFLRVSVVLLKIDDFNRWLDLALLLLPLFYLISLIDLFSKMLILI